MSVSEALAFEIVTTEKSIRYHEQQLRMLRRKLKKLSAFLEEFSSVEPVTDKEVSNDHAEV